MLMLSIERNLDSRAYSTSPNDSILNTVYWCILFNEHTTVINKIFVIIILDLVVTSLRVIFIR